MEISVGPTPDSDDAFMFYAMLTGKIPSSDFTIKHVVGDIEELNKKASNPVLDVTAVSVHACAYIPDYTILRSGGSFGLGYGPIVIAKKLMSQDELKKAKIAIPGKMNTFFPSFIFLLSSKAFWNNFITPLTRNFETNEMHVNALAINPILPDVNTPELGYSRRIFFEQALTSLLVGWEVIAVAFLNNFAALIFEEVFPEIEIMYASLFFII